MRYFKRIHDNSLDSVEVGKIYKEDDIASTNHGLTVLNSVNGRWSSSNWKEVPEIEYIKQQGWYIKGSKDFYWWLKGKNSNISGNLPNYYYFDPKKEVDGKTRWKFQKEKRPKGIEVTIDQLNEIYNPKPKEMKFKVGDEVLVTGWDFAKIRTPQKGLIKGVNKSFCDVKIEEDHHGKVGTWAFKFEFLEPLNKRKEMENFSVKVNETTFNILQDLALENGYKWITSGANKIDFNGRVILNFLKDKKITRGDKPPYFQVSLEEAIDKITTKSPSFEEGEWIVVDNGGPTPALVVYTDDKRTYGFGFGTGNWTDSFNIDHSRIWNHKMRKATKGQVELALIKEAKRRGFKVGVKAHNSNIGYAGTKVIRNNDFDYKQSQDKLVLDCLYIYQKGKWAEILDELKEIFGFKVTKTSNGDYKFGCVDHVYTKGELRRVTDTLGNLRSELSVGELVTQLEKLYHS